MSDKQLYEYDKFSPDISVENQHVGVMMRAGWRLVCVCPTEEPQSPRMYFWEREPTGKPNP